MFAGPLGSAQETNTPARREYARMKSVARITEISAASDKSFEDAIKVGLARANKTLENVTGAWVQSMKVDMNNGKIKAFRVTMKVTFVLKD
jgi:hypothetical protein